jgi:hypothetical protein
MPVDVQLQIGEMCDVRLRSFAQTQPQPELSQTHRIITSFEILLWTLNISSSSFSSDLHTVSFGSGFFGAPRKTGTTISSHETRKQTDCYIAVTADRAGL